VSDGSVNGESTNDVSWIASVPVSDVPSLQNGLAPLLDSLQQRVAAACPGRTGEIIDNAVRGALGLSTITINRLDDGESVVHAVAEQFVIDVHGVTDEQFAGLKKHYAEPEIVSLLVRMALADGLGKLEKVA